MQQNNSVHELKVERKHLGSPKMIFDDFICEFTFLVDRNFGHDFLNAHLKTFIEISTRNKKNQEICHTIYSESTDV